MNIEVLPATAERFDDVARMLAPSRPGTPSCWCLSCRLDSHEAHLLSAEPQRRERMQRLTQEPIAPGMLAYVDGEVAGWVNFGPRESIGRLQRSRTILAVDDVPVWSVLCFVVRPGFRRKGLTRELLRGASTYACEHGAPAIEGYPVDPAGDRLSGTMLFVGIASTFAAEGFELVGTTGATSAGRPRLVMRKTFGG
ncbi:GNAT family N-acetyltransferase [Gryllotalpicola reticulitermitis]|uniref:GNAT family N-acetyltransferase n=1 Tax=Gryllotalpicola reticulitermitis TaxID=1184153 RepID=A0ABV8Q6Q1_9MICO